MFTHVDSTKSVLFRAASGMLIDQLNVLWKQIEAKPNDAWDVVISQVSLLYEPLLKLPIIDRSTSRHIIVQQCDSVLQLLNFSNAVLSCSTWWWQLRAGCLETVGILSWQYCRWLHNSKETLPFMGKYLSNDCPAHKTLSHQTSSQALNVVMCH